MTPEPESQGTSTEEILPSPKKPKRRLSGKERLAALILVGVILTASVSLIRTSLRYEMVPASIRHHFVAALTLDPQERGLFKLMARESKVLEDMDKWLKKEAEVLSTGGDHDSLRESHEAINARIDQLQLDHQAYIGKYPHFGRGYVVYGDFLRQLGEEERVLAAWTRATEVDPTYAPAWSRLAEWHVHVKDLPEALRHYEQAYELDPNSGEVCHSYSVTLMQNAVFAARHFECSDRDILLRIIDLLNVACEAYPNDFDLASQRASLIGNAHPDNTDIRLASWEQTLPLARTEATRESVILNMAIIVIEGNRPDEAMKYISQSTSPSFKLQRKHLIQQVEALRSGNPSVIEPASATVDL